MTPQETVTGAFAARVRTDGRRPALRALVEGGAPREETLTWEAWADASREVAAAFAATGHRPGEAIAILAGNRTLWPVCDLGAVAAGLVSVGLYPTAAPAQIRHALRDAGARTVVVDTEERLERVLEVAGDLPALERIVCEDASPVGSEVERWEAWRRRGERALEDPDVAVELARRQERLGPEDTALLIYTSGSTGEPKGARISHRYLLASAASIRETLGLRRGDTTLSFLPYCHAGERVFGLYTRIACGMETGLVEDHERLWEAARAYRPTLFGGLPRFYEKLHERLRTEGGGVERLLGDRLRVATSGGATLPTEVARELEARGLTVLGAYGLTEHLCVACNRPDRYAFDSAGPPMPGTELRIADDGEILVRRGALTFSGYHGLPEATEAAFGDDGAWLLTGDLGEVDREGFLRVTGRKKELIALSTGKKVAPLPIEAELTSDPWIANAVLCGEGRKFVSALLALRRPAVEAWARERGLDGDFRTLLGHPEVVERVRAAVGRVNRRLSRTERVRRFALLEREFTEEAGELTPTGKLRRDRVADRHVEVLEALYGTDGRGGRPSADGTAPVVAEAAP